MGICLISWKFKSLRKFSMKKLLYNIHTYIIHMLYMHIHVYSSHGIVFVCVYSNIIKVHLESWRNYRLQRSNNAKKGRETNRCRDRTLCVKRTYEEDRARNSESIADGWTNRRTDGRTNADRRTDGQQTGRRTET